jgi:preprotein translocase subunit SecA
LLRCHHGLPKNKALIKFLSEPGMKALMQKTENFYMQEQSKHMHIIDDELYFVIEEKNNSVQLTDKGIDLITSVTTTLTSILSRIWALQWRILKK